MAAHGIGKQPMGWAAGAGVETLIATDLTLKAEYMYVDFPGFDIGGSSVDANAHTVRAGLNWHF